MLGLVDRVRPPDRFQNRAMRHDAVWIVREERQQLEFLGREPDFFVRTQKPTPILINREVPERQMAPFGRLALADWMAARTSS